MKRKPTKDSARFLLLATLTAITLTLTACGGASMQSTPSAEQARENVLNAVHAAAEAIFPPGYRLTEAPIQPRPCTDDLDHETGQISVSAGFWVDGPDRSQNNDYYEKLKKWWTENSWSVETDSRPHDLYANAQRDGYVMSLEGTVGPEKGRLSIGVSSPCIWPHGTPEPQS